MRIVLDTSELVSGLLSPFGPPGETAAPQPLAARLPDPDDEPFLGVALACGANCLVTGNLAHFSPESCCDVSVVSPAGSVERFRSGDHRETPNPRIYRDRPRRRDSNE
ncbi:MAG: hypothetical protein KGZ89_02965 [Actinobacteria bacterium]|nr:hypothetical protein [Actinomycetota bacterium]